MTDIGGGRPAIGDNSGEMTEAEKIAANLAEKHPEIIRRMKEITDKLASVPEVITTKDESDKVSEFVRVCMTFQKVSEALRVEEKEPYLAAERAVDGFFRNQQNPVKDVKIELERRTTAYDLKVMKAEEDRRKEEAKRLAEEAEILAAKAKSANAQDQQEKIAAAAVAQQAAETANADVAVKPAELTRTRTGSGVTRSLRVTWRHEVIEPKKVPKKFLSPDDDLIIGAIKAATTEDGKCNLSIPGVRIYPDYSSQVR